MSREQMVSSMSVSRFVTSSLNSSNSWFVALPSIHRFFVTMARCPNSFKRDVGTNCSRQWQAKQWSFVGEMFLKSNCFMSMKYTKTKKNPEAHSKPRGSYIQMELVMGLEPATCWLQISCSANWATPARGTGWYHSKLILAMCLCTFSLASVFEG